jgi:hypothetical protein
MSEATERDAMWREVADKVDAEGQEIAKAALGITGNADILPMDVSKAALFVHVDLGGNARVSATVPKRQAALWLRKIADVWDQEWKAEQLAEQKAKRGRLS